MLNHHTPHWLYEALPYLYVASGVASLATLDHLLSAFSGLMLVSAGVVVWKLRYNHRHWGKSALPVARRGKARRPRNR